MKTGMVVGEAFVTVTQPSVAREEILCRMCYLMVLNVQKATEDVNARTRTCEIRKFLLLTCFLKLETSEWSLETTRDYI